MRRLPRKLCLSVAALLAAGAVCELAARAAEPGPFSLFDRKPYTDHPLLGHVHVPNFTGRWDGTWYEIDSRGLRGPELPAEKGTLELRVVCLGDSCTFGKGVNEADSWPRQLERLLGDALSGAATPVVANLGVNGYDGRCYRDMFLERGLALEPDVVVVGYNLNDFPNAVRAVDDRVYGQRGLRRLLPEGLRDGLGRTAAYRWLRAAYYAANRERDWRRAEALAAGTALDAGSALRSAGGATNAEVWNRQEDYLREIRDAAAAIGAQVAVFLFPYESQVYLDAYERTPIELLAQRCGRLGIPFISLEAEFRSAARETDPPRELFLYGDRYHPRPEGYALVARRVAALIEEQGWLPAVH